MCLGCCLCVCVPAALDPQDGNVELVVCKTMRDRNAAQLLFHARLVVSICACPRFCHCEASLLDKLVKIVGDSSKYQFTPRFYREGWEYILKEHGGRQRKGVMMLYLPSWEKHQVCLHKFSVAINLAVGWRNFICVRSDVQIHALGSCPRFDDPQGPLLALYKRMKTI